jgi:hypothetical protein
MKKKAYFLNGRCIHIGEWDFQIKPPPIDEKTGQIKIDDATGKPMEPIIRNPIPVGVVVEERPVTVTDSGGQYLQSDYASLRKREYPPFVEQLDALWKGGAEAEAMKARVLAVKAKYPKPD